MSIASAWHRFTVMVLSTPACGLGFHPACEGMARKAPWTSAFPCPCPCHNRFERHGLGTLNSSESALANDIADAVIERNTADYPVLFSRRYGIAYAAIREQRIREARSEWVREHLAAQREAS